MRSIDRRSFLKTSVLAGTAISLLPAQIAAEPTTQTSHDATMTSHKTGTYTFPLGKFHITIISDGYFEAPFAAFGANATAEELAAEARYRFLQGDTVAAQISTCLITTPHGSLLVDSGSPSGAFGPTSAMFHEHFAGTGLTTADVKTIFYTHFHPDHIGGFLDASGKSRFPNAEVFVSKTEKEFWAANPALDKLKNTEETKTFMRTFAMQFLKGAESQIKTVSDGHVFMEGVQLVHLPGHTPGHSGLRISSGDSQMMFITDLVNCPAIQLRHPDWHTAFDIEPELSIETRRKIFDMCASEQMLIAGAHIPFPSLGYLRKDGAGYDFEPIIWR